MELHNPPKLGLPPLLIEKQSSRAEMERSADIIAFIRPNLLLDKQFHALFMELASKSSEIDAAFHSLTAPAAKTELNIVGRKSNVKGKHYELIFPTDSFVVDSNFNLIKHVTRPRLKRQLEDTGVSLNTKSDEEFLRKLKAITDSFTKDHYERLITLILDRSQAITDTLSQFEQDSHVELEILIPETFIVCVKCAAFVSRKRFRNG
jgi:hypothetical protein